MPKSDALGGKKPNLGPSARRERNVNITRRSKSLAQSPKSHISTIHEPRERQMGNMAGCGVQVLPPHSTRELALPANNTKPATHRGKNIRANRPISLRSIGPSSALQPMHRTDPSPPVEAAPVLSEAPPSSTDSQVSKPRGRYSTSASSTRERNHTAIPRPSHRTRPAPASMAPFLYKILPAPPPDTLPAALPLSELDACDGFVHLSTAEQVPGTVARFFQQSTAVWLLRIPQGLLEKGGCEGKGELRWEETKSHGVFAHFYGAGIGEGEVQGCVMVERKEGWDREGTWEGVFS